MLYISVCHKSVVAELCCRLKLLAVLWFPFSFLVYFRVKFRVLTDFPANILVFNNLTKCKSTIFSHRIVFVKKKEFQNLCFTSVEVTLPSAGQHLRTFKPREIYVK